MNSIRSWSASAVATILLAAGAGGASAQEACSTAPIEDYAFDCLCAGGVPTESIWGSNPYTADSGICAAAFHAGAIGEDGGLVSVIPGPGLDSYVGSIGNGIESRDWGAYGSSFEIVTNFYEPFAAVEECTAYPLGEPSYTCACPPYDDTGVVWGSGPYTADSSICLAAMHAGAISDMGGTVNVVATTGLLYYRASLANGVATEEWGSNADSFIIDMNAISE
jgi:hypothetical protein